MAWFFRFEEQNLYNSMNTSPIFVVDSDIDDQELLEQAWQELGYTNKLYFFKTAEEVIDQLETKALVPFLIISEISLPKMSGFELKQYMKEHKAINDKTIPFVFLSATISQKQIERAYDLCTNGVFQKHSSFNELKQQLVDIAKYWAESLVPVN
jgi:CheY-like chemotaxis protein